MCKAILLFFYAYLDVALSGSFFCQRIPHQAYVYAPLSEVNAAGDPCLYPPGIEGAQGLS